MLAVLVITAVIAVTSLFKQINTKDWDGVLTILVAVVIGLVAGLNHFEGLTVVQGLLDALAAVGIHTVVKS
jgi:uncharacterized membrane protein